MTDYVLYKHQTSLEKELVRLKASGLSSRNQKHVESFGRMRLAQGCTKVRVV